LDIGKDEDESPEPPPSLPPSSGLLGGGMLIRLSSVNTGINKRMLDGGLQMVDVTSYIRHPESAVQYFP
jgi:hypothetical protein